MSAEQIQQARNALTTWRIEARDGEWSIESDTAESSWLGRGTAGNPALLDAIDSLLDEAQRSLADLERDDSAALATLMLLTGGGRHRNALRLADAIIAADDRMSR
jgi:hypothetical protein